VRAVSGKAGKCRLYGRTAGHQGGDRIYMFFLLVLTGCMAVLKGRLL